MGSQSQAVNATRLMLPPSLRGAVGVGTNRSGQPIITVDNSVKTSDVLFKNLQRVVNSPGIVSLNVVSPSTPVAMTLANGSQFTAPLQAVNKNGFTLPGASTATGNEPAFSPVKGETQIFVSSGLSNVSQAATVAAELGAHALPALLGQGAAPSSSADHIQREDPLVKAAISNAQQPP